MRGSHTNSHLVEVAMVHVARFESRIARARAGDAAVNIEQCQEHLLIWREILFKVGQALDQGYLAWPQLTAREQQEVSDACVEKEREAAGYVGRRRA
jgi:hypothetical protein